MNLLKKMIRFVWHGVFYALTWKAGLRFALVCRHVVETIDLNELPKNNLDRFRFRLHLSLCQMCSNYYESSLELKKAAKIAYLPSNLDSLNFRLMEKHAKKSG